MEALKLENVHFGSTSNYLLVCLQVEASSGAQIWIHQYARLNVTRGLTFG